MYAAFVVADVARRRPSLAYARLLWLQQMSVFNTASLSNQAQLVAIASETRRATRSRCDRRI